ncbi:cobalt transporter CbiM [Paramagnetospirillum magneticum]|uniref:ABC-type Co2+ transport system, permease component n=1 Tax=Paramagnetospirillum magneticum (strain ATCC 700264 / AMB-1) TaxID=342108 RepID=Q2VZ36_PARM1|nr:cobalt transporter CbiM [Paramagnetospirillum magneticum]BAE53139.1 ABC-type Co2+ transport system, permease component [Paramagnetospirillum magneticum AMB-1]
MAHIPDGVLSGPVLVAGGLLAAAGVARGLKELEPVRVPKVAMLSAVMFVASLIHLPAGPASVHLLLNGMAGIVLGWAAFPALLAALLLQAVLFGFGGLLVLGVNTVNMAVPAVLTGLAFRRLAKEAPPRRAALAAAVCSGSAVLLTGLMVAGSLAASGREFEAAARLVMLSHLPVMGIEAVFASAAIGLLARVKPEALA